MKISWITAKVFFSGNLLKRVKWNEEETSIDGDTPIAIQTKFKNRTCLILSVSDQSIVEQNTPSNGKAWKGMDPSFLDLSASASRGQETGDEEEEEEDFNLEDELDDFIVDSVSTKDSESMLAIYRTALSSLTRTPKCVPRRTQSSFLTPGVTPFSQQTDYDSSFVTDGSGSSGP